MSSFKVSIAFLDGPVTTIIAKSASIVKHLDHNSNFPKPPVSPTGLQDAVEHLKKMHKKVKSGTGKAAANLDQARADVDDYIRQEAEYVNHTSYYDLDKLLSSGFDKLVEKKMSPVPGKVTKLLLRNGQYIGEVIATIDVVQHCQIAIGRVSTDPSFHRDSTTEVIGSSRNRVYFSSLVRNSRVWISVKCRGTNGDSDWCAAKEILVR
jgi:hypothetical protein